MRDLVLLPAIFVATPILLLGLAEAACYDPFYEKLGDACIVADAFVGHKAKPDCVSSYKVADSPWIENRYNDCGYRTAESCGPAPDGAIRAAVIGSSISTGYMVSYPQMFATRAAAALSVDCHRPVQFQDLGGVGYQWDRLYARMREALALKPNLLVMTVTPFDLMQSVGKPTEEPEPQQKPAGMVQTAKVAARDAFKKTAVWRALLYVGALDPVRYLASYFKDADNSGYMASPLPSVWHSRIDRLDDLLKHMADTSHKAGVPFVLLYVPPRSQVILLNHQAEFPKTKPTQLDDTIATEAAKAGVSYIDMTSAFHKEPDVNRMFFVLSDHPTPLGHRLIAEALVSRLLTAGIGPFAGCSSVPRKVATGQNSAG